MLLAQLYLAALQHLLYIRNGTNHYFFNKITKFQMLNQTLSNEVKTFMKINVINDKKGVQDALQHELKCTTGEMYSLKVIKGDKTLSDF